MNGRGQSLIRVRDLLGDVGQRLGMTSPVETGTVWSRWRHIVGAAIAEHAEPSSLKGGILRVRVDSPAWATELGYLSDQIKASVNGAVGLELVREVQVWIGPDTRTRASRSERGTGVVASPRPAPSEPSEALARARQAWARARRHRV